MPHGAAFALPPDELRQASRAGSAPISVRSRDSATADRLRADPVRDGLADLSRLVAAHVELRRELHTPDEEIATAVSQLCLDRASWVQIGAAHEISRQGARQRSGARVDR